MSIINYVYAQKTNFNCQIRDISWALITSKTQLKFLREVGGISLLKKLTPWLSGKYITIPQQLHISLRFDSSIFLVFICMDKYFTGYLKFLFKLIENVFFD